MSGQILLEEREEGGVLGGGFFVGKLRKVEGEQWDREEKRLNREQRVMEGGWKSQKEREVVGSSDGRLPLGHWGPPLAFLVLFRAEDPSVFWGRRVLFFRGFLCRWLRRFVGQFPYWKGKPKEEGRETERGDDGKCGGRYHRRSISSEESWKGAREW